MIALNLLAKDTMTVILINVVYRCGRENMGF